MCSITKVFLEISQSSQENTCARDSFLINCRPEVCNFIKKETLAQVFSCEFCEKACNFNKKETLAQVFFCELCGISKYTFLQRRPLVAASEHWNSSKTQALWAMDL